MQLTVVGSVRKIPMAVPILSVLRECNVLIFRPPVWELTVNLVLRDTMEMERNAVVSVICYLLLFNDVLLLDEM